MTPITIEIAGRPEAWKQIQTHSGQRFTAKKVRGWQDDLRVLARQAMRGRKPISGPVSLAVVVSIVPPQGWPAWKREAALAGRIEPTTVPDLSNYIKSAEDSLKTIVIDDDRQIVRHRTAKRYAERWSLRLQVVPLAAAPHNVSSRKALEEMLG